MEIKGLFLLLKVVVRKLGIISLKRKKNYDKIEVHYRQVVVSLDYCMGKVAKTETLKSPPFTEVWVLARSQNMNKSTEISLMLGEYLRVIPST
jgi:hypothetical protein